MDSAGSASHPGRASFRGVGCTAATGRGEAVAGIDLQAAAGKTLALLGQG
jgi:hypothetical protein